jgi:protein-S-isoprenylcysteine O-methyltransferase Ste14
VKLLDHFPGSGDSLFRWRSYLPLVLVPAFLLSLADSRHVFVHGRWGSLWDLGCLGVALTGLAIRIWTIGTAPAGTSERSTTAPAAARLSTAGIYSVIRHPLYLANSIVVLGMALFTRTWYLPVIDILASLLYHERICAREEVFLEERFGDDFREWAARVPALIPGSGYVPSGASFRWSRVLGREFHALFVIGAGFFVLDAVRGSFAAGRLFFEPPWTWICVATGATFVVLLVAKRGLGFFR